MDMLRSWILGVLIFNFVSWTSSDNYMVRQDHGTETYTYHRFSEIEKECGSVLSQASDLEPNDNRGYILQTELLFINGDWEQNTTTAPLVPFDDSDVPKNSSSSSPYLKLVSFWVMDVNPVRPSKNVISVSGLINIGITRNVSFNYRHGGLTFCSSPGMSSLGISFEGVYVETEVNGGERVMCLLGTSESPFKQKSTDLSGILDDYASDSNYQAQHDDEVILILHYPQTFTLTNRAVYGEMKSLSEPSSFKYFDKVRISSQMNPNAKYHFESDELVSDTCSPYTCQDELTSYGDQVIQEFGFCEIYLFLATEVLDLVNWSCNGTDDDCSKLVSFLPARSTREFHKNKLVLQNLHCEPGTADQNMHKIARVAAVFRAISPKESRYPAVERTGLSDTTLSAEGEWNSSSGQVCMVGCVGLSEGGSKTCNHRICLVVPLVFSIKRRSIIAATISSISETASIFLSFERRLHPIDLRNKYSRYSSSWSYSYSKFELANSIRKRSEAFKLGNLRTTRFLRYSTMEMGNDMESLSRLSDELSLHVAAVQDPLLNNNPSRISIIMEIFSLGRLFGGYLPPKTRPMQEEPQFHTEVASTEHQLLNVSALLTLKGVDENISMLFVEGMYDSLVGMMYLTGCRDIGFLGNSTAQSMDLEGRMDCMIEVQVEYSPKTTRPIINPAVKISISSRRKGDNPLYFSPKSFLGHIYPPHNEQDIIIREVFEKILQILLLSVSIACIRCQMVYARENAESLPYLSLTMLGIHSLMFSLPLISSTEFLFKWKSCFDRFESFPWYQWYSWYQSFQFVVSLMKLALLIASQLTVRLIHKVWKSRVLLLSRAPMKLQQVPSDKLVILSVSAIHMAGFLYSLILQFKNADSRQLNCGSSLGLMQVQGYLVLVQDFFLLPQVIANFMWRVRSKPLRKLYYIGFTIVRILLHVYDLVRVPMCPPCYTEDGLKVPNLSFHSRISDVAAPMILVVLAIVVYIQQSWSHPKLSDVEKYK